MIYTSVKIRDFWTVTFEHTNLRFAAQIAYDDVTPHLNLCSVKSTSTYMEIKNKDGRKIAVKKMYR